MVAGKKRTAKPRSTKASSARRKVTLAPEFRHTSIRHIDVSEIYPCPDNDRVYRPIDEEDADFVALVDSVRKLGVKNPLVVSSDRWIISGHRRHRAAKRAGLSAVPCIIEPISREDDPDEFLRLIVEYNRQREKDKGERLREEVISVNRDLAYQAIVSHRDEQVRVSAPAMEIVGKKRRPAISAAKQPLMDAIMAVLEERKKYLPLSVRAIHYALLNILPLKHASKPDSVYRNDDDSYNSADELLTRMRIFHRIPMDWISDETRPVVIFDVHPNTRQFVRRELDGMMKGYWRDFQRSQPCHIELLVEKNTVASILRPVAARYRIPMTSGRGYSSVPPRYKMAERFETSGKDKLVLLIVSDFDPDGMTIAHSFARSMRDDFGIDEDQLHPIRVALTPEQVQQFNLPSSLDAKPGASQYEKFVEEYGQHAYELEALPPADLQNILNKAIEGAMDVAEFNRQIDAEKDDYAYLSGVRNHLISAIDGLDLGGDE